MFNGRQDKGPSQYILCSLHKLFRDSSQVDSFGCRERIIYIFHKLC